MKLKQFIKIKRKELKELKQKEFLRAVDAFNTVLEEIKINKDRVTLTIMTPKGNN